MIQGGESLTGLSEQGITVQIPVQAISDFVHSQDELVTGNVLSVEFTGFTPPGGTFTATTDTSMAGQAGNLDQYTVTFRETLPDGTNVDETANIIVRNGINGTNGADGRNGFDALVTATRNAANNGVDVTVNTTDPNTNPVTVTVNDGENGAAFSGFRIVQQGSPGTDTILRAQVNGADVGSDITISHGQNGMDGRDGEDGFLLQTVEVTTIGTPMAGRETEFNLNLTGTENGAARGFNARFRVPAGAPGTAGERISQVVDEGIDAATGGRIIDFVVDGAELNTPVVIPRGTPGMNGTNGTNGTDGEGFTGGTYDAATGTVTFSSNDGLGFTTGDLRGAAGANGVLTDMDVVLQRPAGGTVDNAEIVSGQLRITLSDHTATQHDSPDPQFLGTRTREETGAEQTFTLTLGDAHDLFSYVITDLTPVTQNGFTSSFTGNTATVRGTNPASQEFTATATPTHIGGGTVASDVTVRFTITITEQIQVTPFYIFTQENEISLTADQDLSTYTASTTTLMDGDVIEFRRPAGVTGTYHGAVAIPTSGADALTIDVNSSFDQGQSVPDTNTGTATGVARATDYQVYIFPLHLPITRIQVN